METKFNLKQKSQGVTDNIQNILSNIQNILAHELFNSQLICQFCQLAPTVASFGTYTRHFNQ